MFGLKEEGTKKDNRKISELTVDEFRALMQECFDADRVEQQRRAQEEWQRAQRVMFDRP
jgi:hypothetical protein